MRVGCDKMDQGHSRQGNEAAKDLYNLRPTWSLLLSIVRIYSKLKGKFIEGSDDKESFLKDNSGCYIENELWDNKKGRKLEN